MKILHFVTGGPDAVSVKAANVARAEGLEYEFVNAEWALTAEPMECDEIVTDDEKLIKKYKKPVRSEKAPEPEESE